MWSDGHELGRVAASGTPYQIGATLGRAGRSAVQRHLLASDIWREITDMRHAALVTRLAEATRTRFPAIWAEVEGLAEGLGLPVAQVMAWNCRGDLLASVPDGCTTVMLPGREPTIAHNEDGLPFFRGACFLAEVAPRTGAGFLAFCYPGSLPGHTFAIGKSGLVQTVNNLRLLDVAPEVPRMVLGRATLGAGGLDEALAVLIAAPPSGGFHFSLAEQGSSRLVSVEFGAGEKMFRDVIEPELHANHALYLSRGAARQIETLSSRQRQKRGTALLASHASDPFTILRDSSGEGLSIFRRSADDPDHENTLATLVVDVKQQAMIWRIHDSRSDKPAYSSARQAA